MDHSFILLWQIAVEGVNLSSLWQEKFARLITSKRVGEVVVFQNLAMSNLAAKKIWWILMRREKGISSRPRSRMVRSGVRASCLKCLVLLAKRRREVQMSAAYNPILCSLWPTTIPFIFCDERIVCSNGSIQSAKMKKRGQPWHVPFEVLNEGERNLRREPMPTVWSIEMK